MIQSYLAQLRDSFGGARNPVSTDQLRALHARQDYPGMVRLVRDGMGLDVRIRVGLVNHGGSLDAPAWVSTPQTTLVTLITVFLRKSFLLESRFEVIVMAIAHELSHIVLNVNGHVLRECEEAVDLTAMLLGYRDIYVAGSAQMRTVGYLTPEEVRYAAMLLGQTAENLAPRLTLRNPALAGMTKAAAVGGAILVRILGTMICARNAAVDQSKPHIATEWVTLMFFRLWPLGTYRLQLIESSGVGLPLIGGVLSSQYAILDKLPWTSNKTHIIRSLIVGWAFFGILASSALRAVPPEWIRPTAEWIVVLFLAAGTMVYLGTQKWRWLRGKKEPADRIPLPRARSRRDGQAPDDDRKVERDFNNVFFNKTPAERERIIFGYMNSSGCSRTEAMRRAVEDWRKDNRSWRS
jgi:hypothetical protein